MNVVNDIYSCDLNNLGSAFLCSKLQNSYDCISFSGFNVAGAVQGMQCY